MKKLISFQQFMESTKPQEYGFNSIRSDERSTDILRYKHELSGLIRSTFIDTSSFQPQNPLVNLQGKVVLAKSPHVPKSKDRSTKANQSALLGDYHVTMQDQPLTRAKVQVEAINLNLSNLTEFESLSYWVENNERLFVTCLLVIDDTLQQISFDVLMVH